MYRSVPAKAEPLFPHTILVNGRHYVSRRLLEDYKSELVANALGVAPVAPSLTGPDALVPLKQVSERSASAGGRSAGA
jgi:hypothetical protein